MSATNQAAENNRGVRVAASIGDLAAVEQLVRSRLETAAVNSSDVDGSTPDQIDTRQLLPDEDLESGGDNGWSGDVPEWEQIGLDATSYSEIYEIDSDAKADGKIISVFAVTSAAASPSATEIKFSTGTGGEFERLQIEGYLTDEEDTLLLSDPVVFDATEDGQIEAWNGEDSEQDEELILHGITAEKVTTTLEGSERFLSDI